MNIRKIITFTLLSVMIALIAGLSACDRVSQITQPPTPQMAEPSEELAIGVVLPLTGRFTDSFGTATQQGFEFALDEINSAQSNGAKLKLIIKDDQSTVEGAIEAFNELIDQEGVSVILGPSTSSQTEMAFPIAQENQVVAMSPTSAARGLSALGDYVFRVALTTDVLTPYGIETTHAKLGYQRAATMYDETDLFSTDADAAVREILATKGIEVTTETFRGGETDFSEQLTRIQALNPDVIFVSSLPPEKPWILKQGHELGITAPFIVRTLTAADVQAASAVAAEGAMTFVGWGTAVETPGNQVFVQDYSTKYRTEPNNYAARAYATLHILAEAIANVQSTDAAAIRDALANLTDFDTILGKFSFDANGDAVYEPKVLIVKDGELVPFE